MTNIALAGPKKLPQEMFRDLFLDFSVWTALPTQNNYLEITGYLGTTGTSNFPGWWRYLGSIETDPNLQNGTSNTPGQIDFGEMFTLEIAAERGDEMVFIRAVEAIDWSSRTAEDHVRAAHLALSTGAHLKARQLVIEGSARYPEDEELKKMAKILGPSEIMSSNLPAKPDVGKNMQWLKKNGDEYRGKWIALKAGELLAQADNFAEVIQTVGSPRGKDILVTKVY